MSFLANFYLIAFQYLILNIIYEAYINNNISIFIILEIIQFCEKKKGAINMLLNCYVR